MIELVLAHADIARMRFAHSPIRELVTSLRALHDPTPRQMYDPWLSAVTGRLRDVDMELLTAVAPPGRYVPEFILPPPAEPWAALSDDLDALVASSPVTVRAELEYLYRGQDRPIPAVLRPLYDDPAAHLPVVAGEMRKYWQAAIGDAWPRVRALCQADVTYRSEQFVSGGIVRVLEGLHSELSFEGDRLLIDKPHYCVHRFDLAGDGILLIPCVFTWSTLLVTCCSVEQPRFTYPPRGVAELWTRPAADQVDPVSALMGHTRAMMLAALDLPMTTTQLASHLGVRPPTVSEHLKILKGAGLVHAQRRGRTVLYQRTEVAAELLAAVRPAERPD